MIEGEANSPYVLIDESRSLVEISGNSTLKDTNPFYSNLLKWILAFNMGQTKTQKININIQRINDSSLLWLETIIKKLIHCSPLTGFEINWYSSRNNERVSTWIQMLQNQSIMIKVTVL
jgi:hypothetical protein